MQMTMFVRILPAHLKTKTFPADALILSFNEIRVPHAVKESNIFPGCAIWTVVQDQPTHVLTL